ncbi:MAG: hypothetical protein ABI203_06780 [Mucilaginibacter sp.]
MIRSRFIYAMLTLVIVFYFAPAYAQTKKVTKKAQVKTAPKKTPAKKPAIKQKTTANKLGDAAGAQDTLKKGGQANNANGKNNNTLSEEIIVTTAYKPVLADAVKIRRNPDLEDKTPFKAPLTYITLDKTLDRNTEIHQLDPMKMPAEHDSIPGNNFLRAELGNLKTVLGEIYINNGQDDALQVGGYAKHFSLEGARKTKQSEIRDEAGIFGKAITGENTLKGSINYSRLGTYFYGYGVATPPPAGTLPPAQHFSTLSAQGELTKNYNDTIKNDFTYAVKVDGYIFSNAFQAKESNVVLTGFVNKTIKQFYAGLSGSLDFSTQNDSLYSYNNTIVRLNPYLKFQNSIYKIDAGLNFVRESGFSSRIFIFPAVKLELHVIPKYLSMFAEAKGDVNKSTIRDFFEQNPFLGQDIPILNSVDKLDLSVGLKGTLLPGLGFKAMIFHKSVKNLPLFINNSATGYNNFTVVYDGGNSTITGFDGEIDYKLSGTFDIFGRTEFRNYKLATQTNPWNMPNFKLTTGASVNVSPKVSITGSVLYRGSTTDVTNLPTGTVGAPTTTATIPSFAQVNAGFEYKATNKISVFVHANNILNTTNQTWLFYPGFGFNIFGGIGLHF